MAYTPIYTKYPVIEYARYEDDDTTGKIAGSVGDTYLSGGGDNVKIRKGAFLITFDSTYNNPSSDKKLALTLDDEGGTIGNERKKYAEILLSQAQYAIQDPTPGYGFASARLITSKIYKFTLSANGGTTVFGTNDEFISNNSSTSFNVMWTFLYPLDYNQCLSYNSTDDQFEFRIEPLLDANNSVIDCNSLFKGMYILA